MSTRDEWRIDPDRSTLGFSLRHIVVHEIRGHFASWGGTLLIDPVTPGKSSATVWIDLASVDTGEPERDEHLRSAEFFDVKRFARATFESTEVRIPSEGNPVVVGRLDLHGTKREIAVELTGQEDRVDAAGIERRTYVAKAQLDRRAFGLRWNQDLDVGGVVVGDKVEIRIHVEIVRSKPTSLSPEES